MMFIFEQNKFKQYFDFNIIFVVMGSSINDVTVLGGWGQGFCDDSAKTLEIKYVTMGAGGQKLSKIA